MQRKFSRVAYVHYTPDRLRSMEHTTILMVLRQHVQQRHEHLGPNDHLFRLPGIQRTRIDCKPAHRSRDIIGQGASYQAAVRDALIRRAIAEEEAEEYLKPTLVIPCVALIAHHAT